MAQRLLVQEKYDQALGAFDVLITLKNVPDEVITAAVEGKFLAAIGVLHQSKGRFLGFESRTFTHTVEYLTQMIDEYPGAAGVPPALLEIGRAEATAGKWYESETSLKRLLEEFPGNSLSEEAEFSLAEMRFKKIQAGNRSLSAIHEAQNEFELYETLYPEGRFEAEAKLWLRELHEREAQYFCDLGTFYLQKRKTDAAKLYFEKVIASFADTKAAEIARSEVKSISTH